MFQSQQASFSYFSQPMSCIPNSVLPCPQLPNFPSQPPLFPPGTDPYAHSGQFTVTHVEFVAQAQIYEDPNAGPQSWITRQADPISYDATSSVAALNSSSDSNWMNQPSVNNVIGSTPNQTMLTQPVRCELCNIEYDTRDVYEKHLIGKKHKKKLQAKINLATGAFPETSNTSTVAQAGNVSGQIIFGASGLAGQELETKKQKLLKSGAAVDSVMMCTICNVACNSHEVFSKHLSGRRHAAQAGLIAVNGIGPYLAAVRANDHFWNKGKKTTKVDQSTWCDVCQIICNSNDVYAKHLSGRKHLQNLEKLEKSKNGISDPSSIDTAAAQNMGDDDVQKSEKRAAVPVATKEELEMKRRKVLEGGATAAAVRVCTICNVVCNSQRVFNHHLSGQKHAAMLKQQADARN